MGLIYGNKAPVFTLAAVDYSSELRSVKQIEGDGEVTTFVQRASGTRPVALEIEIDLNIGTGKLYNYLVANAGKAGVAWTYKIEVGGAASVSNPLYSGTLVLPATPLLEIEQSAEVQSLTLVFQCETFSVAFA